MVINYRETRKYAISINNLCWRNNSLDSLCCMCCLFLFYVYYFTFNQIPWVNEITNLNLFIITFIRKHLSGTSWCYLYTSIYICVCVCLKFIIPISERLYCLKCFCKLNFQDFIIFLFSSIQSYMSFCVHYSRVCK